MALIGISWIIGYLAERDQRISSLEPYIFEYAYFASLTLCGLLILIVYVLLRRDATTAWRNACCKKINTNKRRRVAGKSSMGATRMSSEGSDYTLVTDPKYSRRAASEEEKMLDPCTSIESLSNRGSHRGSHGGGSARSGHYGSHRSDSRCRTPDSNVSLLQRQYLAMGSDSLPASPNPHIRHASSGAAAASSSRGASGGDWMQHSKI